MPTQSRPILNLTGPLKSLPTLDDLIALAQRLTGREPTPDEIDRARKAYAEMLAQ